MGNKKTAKPTFESMKPHFFGYSASNKYVYIEHFVAFDNQSAPFWTVQLGHIEAYFEASPNRLSLSLKSKFYTRATLSDHLDFIGLRA